MMRAKETCHFFFTKKWAGTNLNNCVPGTFGDLRGPSGKGPQDPPGDLRGPSGTFGDLRGPSGTPPQDPKSPRKHATATRKGGNPLFRKSVSNNAKRMLD